MKNDINKKLRNAGAVLTLFAIAMFAAIFLNAFSFEGNQKENTFAFGLVALIFGLMLFTLNRPESSKTIAEEIVNGKRAWFVDDLSAKQMFAKPLVMNKSTMQGGQGPFFQSLEVGQIKNLLKEDRIANAKEVKKILKEMPSH
jgi:hypothetical protein